MLTFLEGETVGSSKPWPRWVYTGKTLDQVAQWLRLYHEAVADFVPPLGAVWRGGADWSPGLIVGHNDAAPYNAAWHEDALVGFFDWDFAAPVTAEWDLAFTAFSWVPLHARHVVAAEGFTDFTARPRRLRRFLDIYGWSGNVQDFVEVVRSRTQAHADGIHRLATSGDPLFRQLLRQGVVDDLTQAVAELAELKL